MTKKNGYWWGTGRRKTAVSRVRITEGTGKITINGKPYEEYFCRSRDRSTIVEPFRLTKTLKSYDMAATIRGGGPTGQAGATAMGLGRALLVANPELESVLREAKVLTRDARMVERKKYGRAKARRSFQFSKR